MELINLDEAVINALNLFIKKPTPKLNLNYFSFPMVVGSGNAYNAGQVLFSTQKAIYADESNFKEIIKSYQKLINKQIIQDAIIISASGEKDSVWEVKLAKKYKLKTTLLTCNQDSSAAKVADKVLKFNKVSEPYTYNTSTYMGMLIAATGEIPGKIKKFILTLKFPKDFVSYNAYSFVLPDKFGAVCPMLDIKKSELFGPFLSIRAFTNGNARHAKFVIRSKKELVISIGIKNNYYGLKSHRWDISLPKFLDKAGLMALTYFIIGKIQASKPNYFKKYVKFYCLDYGPKAYGKTGKFDLIVPGNI